MLPDWNTSGDYITGSGVTLAFIFHMVEHSKKTVDMGRACSQGL